MRDIKTSYIVVALITSIAIGAALIYHIGSSKNETTDSVDASEIPSVETEEASSSQSLQLLPGVCFEEVKDLLLSNTPSLAEKDKLFELPGASSPVVQPKSAGIVGLAELTNLFSLVAEPNSFVSESPYPETHPEQLSDFPSSSSLKDFCTPTSAVFERKDESPVCSMPNTELSS
ncbi:hypothetical protein NECID01_1491 [Nematocida sp. AWRm77]|nr:hypothetical protein NECID01_1491 [Nematocida sp. AWRm77]